MSRYGKINFKLHALDGMNLNGLANFGQWRTQRGCVKGSQPPPPEIPSFIKSILTKF